MTDANHQRLLAQLIQHEGLRFKLYQDSKGVPTIGVGHNLRDRPISRRAVMGILDDDLTDVYQDLDRKFPWWRDMSEVRQRVLADMCFNMGLSSLLGFKQALSAMQRGDYEGAAQGMEDSKWYREDVPVRAARLVAMMRQDSEAS